MRDSVSENSSDVIVVFHFSIYPRMRRVMFFISTSYFYFNSSARALVYSIINVENSQLRLGTQVTFRTQCKSNAFDLSNPVRHMKILKPYNGHKFMAI